jgi:5'-3' exoribonuclease 2
MSRTFTFFEKTCFSKMESRGDVLYVARRDTWRQYARVNSTNSGKKKEKVGEYDDQTVHLERKPFVFLHVAILREYLDIELRVLDLPFDWNLERAMDDWVFMCFFVGNDFLPHLPSLEIREGAIDTLIEIWKKNLASWGYITDSGQISLELVNKLMMQLGTVEDEVFAKRRDADEGRRMARLRRKKETKARAESQRNYEFNKKRRSENEPQYESFPVKDFKQSQKPQAMVDNMEAAKRLKLQLLGKKTSVAVPLADKVETVTKFTATQKVMLGDLKGQEFTQTASTIEEVLEEGHVAETDSSQRIFEELSTQEEVERVSESAVDPTIAGLQDADMDASTTEPESVDSDEEAPDDNVRLWESGWKVRYYRSKFQVDVGDEDFRRKVVDAYIEGLCWVLRYYYQGVASWQWYFPFHYSPFASDFNLTRMNRVDFQIGEPFKPIEQLMGVLPAASRSHIPTPFHSLMMNEDSPVIDFYPTDFPIDLNGKKFEWQGVALLPFIESARLLAVMKPIYNNLRPEEVKRNTLGNELLFFGKENLLFEDLCLLYGTKKVADPKPLDPLKSDRMSGHVLPDPEVCIPGSTFTSPLFNRGLPDIADVRSLS